MDAELNMNKIRRFGELQEEIFHSTEAWVPLITFDSDDGFAIHNPFMDVSGRFEVDPVKEYGEDNIRTVSLVIDLIERDIGVSIDEINSEDLRMYLGSAYYETEKPEPLELMDISYGGFELTNESEESIASDTIRFGVNPPERFERFFPEAARALVVPVDHGKEIEFCAKYSIQTKESSLIAIVDGDEYEAELSALMKDVLLTEMDFHVQDMTGKSLEEYARDNVERQIFNALEEEAKKQWYLGDQDGLDGYIIKLTADYRENNEFLLKTAYLHRNDPDLGAVICDEIYDGYLDTIAFYEDELLKGAGFEVIDPNYDLAREILQEKICFAPDYGHFLGDDMKVNLMLGTANERNSDFTDIYENMFEQPDNGLYWLVKQQGYTLRELSNEMADYVNDKEASPDRKFLRSVCEELNNTPYEMGCLTVLMQSSLGEMSTYAMDDSSEFVLPKDTMLGIFNPWNGSGSLLEIQLEKELVIPKEMIWDYQIEGARAGGYTVDQVYGLIGSCWKPAIELRTQERMNEKEGVKQESELPGELSEKTVGKPSERPPLESRITEAQSRISADTSEKTEKGRMNHHEKSD